MVNGIGIRRGRPLGLPLAALLLMTVSLLVVSRPAPAAAATRATVDANGGTSVNLRSGPGTNYGLVGSVAHGATVTIVCTARGTTHSGKWGPSDVWDKLDNGRWISDAFVNTGSADPVEPPCVQLSLPFAAGETWTLSSGPHNFHGVGTPWSSLDLAGGSGVVRAAADGTAYRDCGNFVRIDHGSGWQTSYYHLVDIAVSHGQRVSRGQVLGSISTAHGCGGSADGAHVHFTVWRNIGPFNFSNEQQVNLHGLTIGGWTVRQAAVHYEGCLRRLSDGNVQCAPSGQVRA